MKALLIAYDNESFIHYFPQGLAYIAAVLERNDVKVDIYSQDLHHWPDAHLTKYLDDNEYDMVGVSVIGGYYQYRKLMSISKAINLSKNRHKFKYIIGGHGPTPDPTYFLLKTQADIVVMGEGEETIENILYATKLSIINGIAYRDGDNVIINPRRPLIDDVDIIKWPAYHLFPMQYYRLFRMPHCSPNDFVMSVLSARGCVFKCNFCYRMDEGYRARDSNSVIEEVKFLIKVYGITYIMFSDELTMGSVERTESICNSILKEGLNIKWCCPGRLNFAKPDLLKLMKKAGCVFVNYGIESMNDNILRDMNKSLTVNQIIKGVEATIAAGISPGLNILFGHIGDNIVTLGDNVAFLLKYADTSQLRTIRPVTPYPGSALFDYAVENGSIKDVADFYENLHINSDLASVQFSNMDNDSFHDALYKANANLIQPHYDKVVNSVLGQAYNMYYKNDASFRGFRQS